MMAAEYQLIVYLSFHVDGSRHFLDCYRPVVPMASAHCAKRSATYDVSKLNVFVVNLPDLRFLVDKHTQS